jgi:hypothetical protein
MTMRDDYLAMVDLYHGARRERDEARAIARRLRACMTGEDDCEPWLKVCNDFDALPWAKDNK